MDIHVLPNAVLSVVERFNTTCTSGEIWAGLMNLTVCVATPSASKTVTSETLNPTTAAGMQRMSKDC